MLNTLGTWTFFKRETRRFLKVYMQTILSPVVSNLLFMAIFGLSLHRAIPNVEGVTYLTFLIPGLVMMGIINNAFQNPSSSMIIAKYQGIITDLLTIPLKRGEILFAMVASAVFRGLLVGLVTFLTTAIFAQNIPFAAPLWIFVSAILVSLFFSFLGVIIGIWANEFDQVAFILNFIMTPLIFLGGVFYPIQTLPAFAQTISQFNPMVYMIDLMRYGFTGLQTYPVLQSFAVVGGLTLITGIAAYLLMRSGWRLQT